MRPSPLSALACLLLSIAAASSATAAGVFRCEAADGRVTYTNEPCPQGAKVTRPVDDSPAVQSRTAAREPAKDSAAREPAKDSAARDPAAPKEAAAPAAAGKAVEAGTTAPLAPARAAVPAGGISRVQAANTSALSPEQQIERLDQERARQRRQCQQLQQQINFARVDVNGALPSARASAELQLRRLQDEYLAQCPAQR